MQRQTGRHHSVNPTPAWQHRCQAGRYFNLSNFQGRDTETFNQVVAWMISEGLAGDLTDPKYQDPAVRRQEARHMTEIVQNFCLHHNADELYQRFQEFEFPCGDVRSPDENLAEPHFYDRGFFVSVEHPELGQSYTYPGAPYRFRKTPWLVRRRAPLLGEDNAALYCRELGLSRQQLAVLTESGAV